MKILVIGGPSNRQQELLRQLVETYGYEVVHKTQEEFYKERGTEQEVTRVWIDECSDFVAPKIVELKCPVPEEFMVNQPAPAKGKVMHPWSRRKKR
jgi:hypothetical protein